MIFFICIWLALGLLTLMLNIAWTREGIATGNIAEDDMVEVGKWLAALYSFACLLLWPIFLAMMVSSRQSWTKIDGEYGD